MRGKSTYNLSIFIQFCINLGIFPVKFVSAIQLHYVNKNSTLSKKKNVNKNSNNRFQDVKIVV